MVRMDMLLSSSDGERDKGNIRTTFCDLTIFELAEGHHCIPFFAWGKVDLHKVGAMFTLE